ncbi:hypothetical protein AU467_33005 [Mesorhizobium loti]|uniref:Uncharacterized protein n=1 Tax=Rhizobium loti TaxID=381 RepID=A0A124GFH3_RHILI|nr:hypothetical protein AU467_33005 [Mesorhizobium loti]
MLEKIVWWMRRLREEDLDALLDFGWDIEGVPELADVPRSYSRQKRRRATLAPRRPGEERLTSRRYSNPYANVPGILPPPGGGKALAIAAE